MSDNRSDWVKGVAHWCENDVAFISVAFTWRLPEARKIAEFYRTTIGVDKVRVGGPGTFTQKKYVAEFADEVGGSIPDAIARHNPRATRASYGCPVGCWFCIVPKMDGKTFTLLPDFPVRPVLCDDCMDRIKYVIAHGGEPYAQPFIKLNALVKEPALRHDWTALKLRQVQRWVNRHLWRKVPFSEYDASVKTSRPRKWKGVFA
jgi:radical SAM superfamily enzyme YgiQ (UPF0313 family)